MKIGKITLDGYENYGNALQNYALQEFLKKYADTVDTLWHTERELINNYWKWDKKEKIKYLINYKGFRNSIKDGRRAWELARRVKNLDFQQRYINIRYDIDDLECIKDEYDFFIVGSDQVWNPYTPNLKYGFLDFASPEKRISFAASMGAEFIPDDKKDIFKKGLNGLQFISVREDKCAEVVKGMTGKEVQVVIDPVFCVKKEQWNDISVRPYWLRDENYIFAYFLGETPLSVIKYAQSEGCRIFNCFDNRDMNLCILSPEEWIFMISHAKCVMTDSFHATAFSIIFNKPFFVFQRNDDDIRNKGMITRMISLLSRFGFDDRLVSENTDISKIKWNEITSTESVITSEINKSDLFIRKALGI